MIDDDEYERWMRQARHTLESAERDRVEGDYAWGCFKAEQAAQFAVKGLLRALGDTAFGHALTRLVQKLGELGITVPADIVQAGRDLEREYIPTRYGDVYPSGSPFEFYDDSRAAEAIGSAVRVLDFVEQEYAHACGD